MAGSGEQGQGSHIPRTARPGDRVPPHSEDAEQAVLGCILQDAARVLDLCVERQIAPDSFYLPTHSLLYENLLEMHQASKAIPIDFVTVLDRLQGRGELETIGGEVALSHFIESTPTTAHAEYYIQRVYECHLLRKMLNATRDLAEECYRGDASADQLLSTAEETFYALGTQKTGNDRTWNEVVKAEMVEVERLLTEKKSITGISTGFANLDRILLGLQKSDLVILAARPSMGKTSLALNIAENVALGARKQPPKAVAVFSLEMSAESLVRRMVCGHARVSAQKLSTGLVSDEEHRNLVNAADVLSRAPIYVDDSAGLEAMDLRARARRLKRKYDIELIVVDYLQLMHYSKYSKDGLQRETAAISQSLKAMAKELKIPVVVLSQLNRSPETRGSGAVPKLSDLRDSGAIEQDADVVLLLRRPCKYPNTEGSDDPRLAIVDVAKHRNGATGEVNLNFEDMYTRFDDRVELYDHDEDERKV